MARSTSIGVRAAEALDARRRNVQYRWIQRVVTCEPYSLRPDLSLPAALGQIGVLLDGLSEALRAGLGPTPDQREQALRRAVRRHAELRAAQGFRPEELIAEFRALRCEVWHVLHQGLVRDRGVCSEEVFELGAMANYAIDTLMLGTVAAWREVEQGG
ncbi:MAG: RsbRD N-terminal domain-containing protein [Chloroflexi bacterium]|nr:RsbRD N-terminal domain-containing protein [Chloroflexota bacterium]